MDVYGIALPLENPRLGHRPSVGLHEEADARGAILAGEHLGVDAHVRVERDSLARDVVDCDGLGVRAHAALELLRADLQTAAPHGLVPARRLPAAHHLPDRQLVQPHARVGVRGGVTLDARYNLGVANIYDSSHFKEKTSVIMLTLGYKIPF